MIELANCRKSGDRSLLSGSKQLGEARGWFSCIVCLYHPLTSTKNILGCSRKKRVSGHFRFCRSRTELSPFPQGVKLFSHWYRRDGFDRTVERVRVSEWFVDKHIEKCLFYPLVLLYAMLLSIPSVRVVWNTNLSKYLRDWAFTYSDLCHKLYTDQNLEWRGAAMLLKRFSEYIIFTKFL